MDKATDQQPAAVPQGEQAPATQAGSIRDRWSWVEPSVWTERMLTALEQGVKGGVWFSLIDKVHASKTLEAAWAKVQANQGAAGIDEQSVAMFASQADKHLRHLHEQLRQGTYQPQPVRRVWIDKAGSTEKRPLGIPAVRDRVVQTALRMTLEPIWEARFAEHSYGFRPGRGCKDALRRVEMLLKEGYTWVVDADLKGYFDSIPHGPLMAKVRQRVADGRVLALLEAYLHAKVMDGLQEWEPDRGTPQGAVISPLLANLYLDNLDHAMAQAGYQMVRYADDFVILCRSQAEAEQALVRVQQHVEAQGLTLHPTKTRLVDARQKGGFDFLGYHFERSMRWPRKKSLDKFKDKVRVLTPRNSGHSLLATIGKLNDLLCGWFQYFKHSHFTTFGRLDGWIRMRVRSILRQRAGREGRGRGLDHRVWPNDFFAKHGLLSLTRAHAVACQFR
jgi:RNA-directed DNA polymerase